MSSLRTLGRVPPGTAYVAGNDVFSTALQVTFASAVRVLVSVNAAVVMSYRQNSVNNEYNVGVALTANRLYEFTMDDHPDDGTFNIRFDGNCTINKLIIKATDSDTF